MRSSGRCATTLRGASDFYVGHPFRKGIKLKLTGMKGFLILMALNSVTPVHADTLLASTLYKACSAQQASPEYGTCLGFVAGVANSALPATQAAALALGGYNEITASKAADASGRIFGCGENYRIKDTIQHFIKFIDAKPELKSQPAVLALTQMMAKQYECSRVNRHSKIPSTSMTKNFQENLDESPGAMTYICWGLALKTNRSEAAEDLSKMIGWFRKNNEYANQMHRNHVAYSAAEVARLRTPKDREAFFDIACRGPLENVRNSIKNGMFD